MVIGRVALVTGSATGIGRWIVLKLAIEGIDVAVNYRKSKRDALSLVKEVSKLGVQAKAYKADVSNPSQAERLVASIVKDLGQLDILVNNAGDWSYRSIMETTDEEFDSIVKGNYHSAFYCTRAAIPHLRKSRNGRIVNIGIVGAQEAHGIGSMGPYMGAKAAMVAFTRSLSSRRGQVRNNRERRLSRTDPGQGHVDQGGRAIEGPQDTAGPSSDRGGHRQCGPVLRQRPGLVHHRERAARHWGMAYLTIKGMPN